MSVADNFKHNNARKNVIMGAGAIMVCITLLSCVSSFTIFLEGFADLPRFGQYALAGAAVIVIEGAFIWLVYGFAKAFSTFFERVFALIGLAFLITVMATNIITHFMIVKRIPLNEFQNGWVSWGAPTTFIVVLIIVLLINLCEPVARLVRQENRVVGKQHEVILQARGEAIDGQHVQNALITAAQIEGETLAAQIIEMARERAQLADGSASYSAAQPVGAFRKPPAPRRGK